MAWVSLELAPGDSMSEFTNVTVLKRANLYFDGKVCVVTYYCWSFLD